MVSCPQGDCEKRREDARTWRAGCALCSKSVVLIGCQPAWLTRPTGCQPAAGWIRGGEPGEPPWGRLAARPPSQASSLTSATGNSYDDKFTSHTHDVAMAAYLLFTVPCRSRCSARCCCHFFRRCRPARWRQRSQHREQDRAMGG